MSDNNNPYAAPSSNLEQPLDSGDVVLLPTPRTVSVGRGVGWISEGFQYFKRSPLGWILGLVVGFILLFILNLIPYIGPIVYTLITYVVFGGIMLGCHAQSRGEQFQVSHLFAGFKNPTKLVILSIVIALLTIAVFVAVMGTAYLKMMTIDPTDTAAATQMMGDPTGFLLQFLIAMLFIIPITMAAWFAPALIAINDVSVMQAMKMSFMGCLKNILPFLLFGIVGLILVFVGTIPVFLGLLVVFPMLTAASYVAYREIFLA